MKKYLSLDKLVYGAIGLAVIVAVFFIIWSIRPKAVTVTNGQSTEQEKLSPLTGLPCDNPSRRPVAVMVSSDAEARPLSGLGGADMVFEMPVTPNGITRMMAVFQCGSAPKEIGSIRSARQDFIPLAQGLQAIYAHWGGEHNSLEALNNHIIDNIDALAYEGTTFYRKKGISAPHNGFSTLKLIGDRADNLGYATSVSLTPYPHTDSQIRVNLTSLTDTITADWPLGMDVRFSFNPDTNSYMRWRGGKPEIDATTQQQVSASVIVRMRTTASFLRDQYINVNTTGQGSATVYQNGQQITALWKKATAKDMLIFTDASGKPIPLTPGRIWVLVDAPLPQP